MGATATWLMTRQDVRTLANEFAPMGLRPQNLPTQVPGGG